MAGGRSLWFGGAVPARRSRHHGDVLILPKHHNDAGHRPSKSPDHIRSCERHCGELFKEHRTIPICAPEYRPANAAVNGPCRTLENKEPDWRGFCGLSVLPWKPLNRSVAVDAASGESVPVDFPGNRGKRLVAAEFTRVIQPTVSSGEGSSQVRSRPEFKRSQTSLRRPCRRQCTS